MPYEPKIRLTKGNSYRVTIPIDVIEELQWKKGDILRLSLEKDKIILRKIEHTSLAAKRKRA
jgi:bifunctional DNA-binding transcriptional regulator/antitoxin component of YhaV-PrlF toxin-antitoxin module